MPIYEYECEKCRIRFELKRHFGEDGGACCPQCRSEARRIFTPVPIIFKGPGFYVTDHGGKTDYLSEKGDKPEAAKKPEEAKPEPETKSPSPDSVKD